MLFLQKLGSSSKIINFFGVPQNQNKNVRLTFVPFPDIFFGGGSLIGTQQRQWSCTLCHFDVVFFSLLFDVFSPKIDHLKMNL